MLARAYFELQRKTCGEHQQLGQLSLSATLHVKVDGEEPKVDGTEGHVLVMREQTYWQKNIQGKEDAASHDCNTKHITNPQNHLDVNPALCFRLTLDDHDVF